MKKTAFFVLTIMVVFTAYLSAEPQHGRSLYQYGNSAASMGRAGTGVSSTGVELFHINPASIAAAERLGLGLQYGSLPLPNNYYNPEVALAVPTSYGTAGVSYRYFNFPDASGFTSGGILSVGGAKGFTERVELGMAVNIFYGSHDKGNLYYFGSTIGSRYRIPDQSSGEGFGLFNSSAGLALNFGLPLGTPAKEANFNTLTAGIASRFYRAENYDLGFYVDVSAIDAYSSFPVKIGLESEIENKYIIRAGAILPVKGSYDYGDYTAGAGYRFGSEEYDGTLNYAINISRNGNLIHYVGATIEYGKLDRTPPETRITPDLKYISPNNSGVQDQVYFTTEVRDESRIEGWKLQIINDKGKVVREFSEIDRDIIESFTWQLFIERIFARKESLVVPKTIMWDGADDYGSTVSDGRYTYSFYAWDERGNISDRKEGTIIVDTVAPEVKLSIKDRFFAPTGDGHKDRLIIQQDIKSEPEDIWNAGFEDASGRVIKSYEWTGRTVPSRVVWDGLDDAGKEAPEGLYRYFIESTDKAGNRGAASFRDITLTRAPETADITVSEEYFSYVHGRDLVFRPYLSKKEGLEFWKVTVTDARENVVREFTGDSRLPNEIRWNGLDSEGRKLKDGVYYVKIDTEFITGIITSSFRKQVVIDSTPPKIRVSTSPDLFAPDNDGRNDILTIEIEYSEMTGIRDWEITIYDSIGEPFKTFTGKNEIPKMLLWDGRGDDKELVESASEYFIKVEAVDLAGNRGVSNRDKIDIDILVIVTERGLLMRISNIHFDFDSAQLKEPSFKVLDRVYEILTKYRRYKVEIEGHTDDIGPEDYNLRLSERRANSVKEYLIRKGIEPERLSSVGRGKTVPVYDVTKETDKSKIYEMRRKNRRVEFILIRSE